jgi:alkanesulfonate monooxygenase
MGGYVDTVLQRVGKFADGWISYFYTPESFDRSWRKVLDSAKSSERAIDRFGNCDMIPARLDDDEDEARQVANNFIAKHCDLPTWSEATPNSAILGTSKNCARAIEYFVKAGVDELVLMPAVSNLNEIDEQIERFGKELLPSFS